MTRTPLILLATGGSLALLLGAFAFQYLGGLAPCHLCLLQRWPHAAAVVIGTLALAFPGRLLPGLGALSALTTAGLGLYHSGVEQKWWLGPDTCTSGNISNLSPEDLTNHLLATTTVVRCDEIAWAFANLSMASWNALLSLGLALLWLLAARRS